MKTTTVTVHQAKTSLSRLLHKAANGEQVSIVRGTKPVARLVLIGEVKGKPVTGFWQGWSVDTLGGAPQKNVTCLWDRLLLTKVS